MSVILIKSFWRDCFDRLISSSKSDSMLKIPSEPQDYYICKCFYTVASTQNSTRLLRIYRL